MTDKYTSTVVIAAAHRRYDALVSALEVACPQIRWVRVEQKDDLSLHNLESIGPRWIFFPHWSWIIPEEVFSAFDCVIFHMTDLPYGRGGTPLQNLIVLGHRETKVSALRCVAELDAGPIYGKRPLSLAGTAEEILCRAMKLIEELIVWIIQDEPIPVPQQGEVVIFKRRHPLDGDISKIKDLSILYDYIRMLDAEGYPPAFLRIGDIRLEFTAASFDKETIKANVTIRKGFYE